MRRLLDSGAFPIHARLPPERTLANELGISRGLLRSTLAQLEAEGRIWRHVGQGTFVGGRAPGTKSEIALISNRTSPAEVFEARLAIEPQCASYAALHATLDDINHISHCIQKMDRAPNKTNYFRWDATLHRAIVEATHNTLLLDLYDAISSTRDQLVWCELFHAADPDDVGMERVRQQHHAILEAIRRRNAATAARRMRQHIEDVRDLLLRS